MSDDIPERRRSVALMEELTALPLFAGAPTPEITALLQQARLREVGVGEVLIQQDAEEATFFVVIRGAFEVAVGSGSTREVVAQVGPGELLGEASLYRRAVRRSAEARATQAGAVLELDTMALARLSGTGSKLPRAIERAALDALAVRVIASNRLVDRQIKEAHAATSATKGFFARLRGILRQ